MKRAEHTLLFLVLLFLPTQLGKHFFVEFSFVYSIPIDYLSPTIYFWDLLVLGLLGVWAVQRKPFNKVALNLFLFFIFTQSLSLLNGSFGVGLVRLEQYFIAGLFGVYLASINLEKVKSIIFWSLSFSILGQSMLAIAQFLKGGTIGFWILGERTFSITTPAIAKFDFRGLEFLRPYATFPHPNVLAAFLVLTLPLLQLFKSNGSMMSKISVVAAGIALVLTVSRAALLAGIIEAFILLRKKWIIFIIFIIIIISPILLTRFSAIFNFDNLTLLRREEQSGLAWNIFLSNPLIGVGLNNFIPSASDQLLVGPSRFLQPVHNIFLLSLAETGVVGFLGLVVLMTYPIWRLFKLYPIPYTLNPLLVIWSVIIFLGLFDHFFLTLPQGYRLLFLIWGIPVSMLEWKRAKFS